MTGESFDKIVDERLAKIKQTLLVKAKEYVRNNNSLHNFEVGSQMTGETPLKVLDGFLLKHLISYRDIINDYDEGKLPSEATINEKFGDIIVYFIIQEAQIKNLINQKKD